MKLKPKYRYELKYVLPLDTWNKLKYDLLFAMNLDLNILNGEGYTVTSLYFDDLDLSLYEEKNEGYCHREKLRIRCYNHKSDNIKFEIKGKNDNAVYKQDVQLTLNEYQDILNQKYDCLLTKGLVGEKLYWKLVTELVRPKVVVEYDRIAFMVPLLDIRISADTHLRGNGDFDIFKDNPSLDLLSKGLVVLEIKGSEEIPRFIKDIVKQANATQTQNSKYALAIERIIKGELIV
jgi:hypothetical protein